MDKERYNESFDDWFREAANQPEPPFNEEAWLKMEALLKREEKKRRRFIVWWWFSGFLLAALLLYSLYPSDRKPFFLEKQQSKQTTGQVPGNDNLPFSTLPYHGQPSPGMQPPGTTSEQSGRRLQHEGQPQAGETVRPSQTVSPSQTESHSQTVLPSQSGSASKSVSPRKGAAGSNPLAISNAATSTGVGRPAAQQNQAGRGRQKARNDRAEPFLSTVPAIAANDAKDNAGRIARSGLPAARESRYASIFGQQEKATRQFTSKAELFCFNPDEEAYIPPVVTPERKLTRRSHFYLYAAALPEWSVVVGNPPGKLTLGYGGGLGYRFGKRWAIQAGATMTDKKYEAGAGDYKPKPGSYYDNPNYKIKEVYAQCDVLELPLVVRYDLKQNKKYNLFIAGGLVSTVMKKEEYNYDYLRYGNQAYSSYTYKTNSFRWFSGATLSFGYERPLYRRFTLQLAPYIGVPLKGVGEGSVKLTSFGLQTGIRYDLPF